MALERTRKTRALASQRVNERMATLLALEGGLPRTGKLRHPRADPKPQMCHLPGQGDCLACGGLLGVGQGHCAECQGIPASALTTHSRDGGSQEAMLRH